MRHLQFSLLPRNKMTVEASRGGAWRNRRPIDPRSYVLKSSNTSGFFLPPAKDTGRPCTSFSRCTEWHRVEPTSFKDMFSRVSLPHPPPLRPTPFRQRAVSSHPTRARHTHTKTPRERLVAQRERTAHGSQSKNSRCARTSAKQNILLTRVNFKNVIVAVIRILPDINHYCRYGEPVYHSWMLDVRSRVCCCESHGFFASTAEIP